MYNIYDYTAIFSHLFFFLPIDCVGRLSTNPFVKRFANGKARLRRVQFKEDLVTEYIFDEEDLVTEYVVHNTDDLSTPKCNGMEHFSQSEELRSDNRHGAIAASLLDESEPWESKVSCSSTISNIRDPPSTGSCSGRDPPSRRSYSIYQRSSSILISIDPPTIITE